MAFLNDFSKTVTDAAYYTAKKTGELTGIARVKFNIKAEQIRLRSTYTKIGSLFYAHERQGVDNSDEIATLIIQADKIRGDISAYRKKLAELKEQHLCPSCGEKVPKNARFCPMCGMKSEKHEEETEDETDYDPFVATDTDDEDEDGEDK